MNDQLLREVTQRMQKMMSKGLKDHNLGFNSTYAHGNATGMNLNKAAHGVMGGSGSIPNQGLKLSQSATIAYVSQQIGDLVSSSLRVPCVPGTANVVALLGVPLNTLGDIDNLTKAIDLGKLEVWLDLPSEKHTEVMETIWAMWDAFFTQNPNVYEGTHTSAFVLVQLCRLEEVFFNWYQEPWSGVFVDRSALLYEFKDSCKLLLHDGTVIGDSKEVARVLDIIKVSGPVLGSGLLNIKKTRDMLASCNGMIASLRVYFVSYLEAVSGVKLRRGIC
ncbi:hypothetical protein Tco_0093235 [Tanacetum coccineum]